MRKGGLAPHYFWWGRKTADQFRVFKGKDTKHVSLRLTDLPKEFISFTFPDRPLPNKAAEPSYEAGFRNRRLWATTLARSATTLSGGRSSFAGLGRWDQ